MTRIVVTLGAVRVNGRPVGPHTMRVLRAAWAGGETRLHLVRAEYKRRMSAMHAAYRAKSRGQR